MKIWNIHNNDGSLAGQLDGNTGQIFDSGHSHIGSVDTHNQSILDPHGQTALHVDSHSGQITDAQHASLGTMGHLSGTPVDSISMVSPSGHVDFHVTSDGDILNSAFQHLGRFQKLW